MKKNNNLILEVLVVLLIACIVSPLIYFLTNSKVIKNNKKEVIKKLPTTSAKKNIADKTKAKKVSTKKANSKIKQTSIKSKKISKQVKKVKKPIEIVESYDLPYRYNETIVKILYQTPDTLFVYWDIADSDRENYIKQYGENFFEVTHPILIVHNDTYNYSFEIPINDFANSWYLHVNDSNCEYSVELGRRPKYYNEERHIDIPNDYLYVTSSNLISIIHQPSYQYPLLHHLQDYRI